MDTPLKAWRKANRDTRTNRPMTQSEAAKKAGVTAATWSRWESGVAEIGNAAVLRVSKLTGVPPQILRPDLYPANVEVAA